MGSSAARHITWGHLVPVGAFQGWVDATAAAPWNGAVDGATN